MNRNYSPAKLRVLSLECQLLMLFHALHLHETKASGIIHIPVNNSEWDKSVCIGSLSFKPISMVCNFLHKVSTCTHDKKIKEQILTKLKSFYYLSLKVAFTDHFIIYFIYFQKEHIEPTSKTKIIFSRCFTNLIDVYPTTSYNT